jgi:hypothetical protein
MGVLAVLTYGAVVAAEADAIRQSRKAAVIEVSRHRFLHAVPPSPGRRNPGRCRVTCGSGTYRGALAAMSAFIIAVFGLLQLVGELRGLAIQAVGGR